MILTIDTEKENPLFIRGSIKALEAFLKETNIQYASEVKKDSCPLIIEGQEARIGKNGTLFGKYFKDDKEKWYTAVCILGAKNDLIASPEGCEKWLKDRYDELVTSIIDPK